LSIARWIGEKVVERREMMSFCIGEEEDEDMRFLDLNGEEEGIQREDLREEEIERLSRDCRCDPQESMVKTEEGKVETKLAKLALFPFNLPWFRYPT
jgi:hypothetical protein